MIDGFVPSVRVTIDGHIATVTLDRPAVLNAVDGRLAAELERAVTELEADPRVRCCIIKGGGDRAFCVGGDLGEISRGRAGDLTTAIGGYAGFTRYPKRKPWIAAVQGYALGGGLEIALACDLIIASVTARFGLPEVSRGLIAASGGAAILPLRVPPQIARELICTGALIDGQRAFEVGLANKVVAPEELDAAAFGMANTIAENSPLAVQESLGIARMATEADVDKLLLLSDHAYRRVEEGDDFTEGPRAFLEKRKPNWKT